MSTTCNSSSDPASVSTSPSRAPAATYSSSNYTSHHTSTSLSSATTTLGNEGHWPDSATRSNVPPEGVDFNADKKKNHYDLTQVWPCRGTQLTPDLSIFLPGEPRILDIEMVHVQVFDASIEETFYVQAVGRVSVLNTEGKVGYDVYAFYPAKGKTIGNYEILRKGYPPKKFMVELPDTFQENGAQPAHEVERNLKKLFANSPVVVWDQRGDTTCYLYETYQSMFVDNGATIIDAQSMYSGLYGALSPFQPSLKDASRLMLDWDPQDDGNHDPRRDADATRELYLRKVSFDRARHEADLRAKGWYPRHFTQSRPIADRANYRGSRRGIEAAAENARVASSAPPYTTTKAGSSSTAAQQTQQMQPTQHNPINGDRKSTTIISVETSNATAQPAAAAILICGMTSPDTSTMPRSSFNSRGRGIARGSSSQRGNWIFRNGIPTPSADLLGLRQEVIKNTI